MKKVVFVISLIACSTRLYAQTENTPVEKRMKYGFNLGINYSNLITKRAFPAAISKSTNLGFQLGILADYEFSRLFSISPKTELSFNNNKLNLVNADGSPTTYKVMPLSLDLMTHFIFKDYKGKINPYFLFGPNVKLPISKKTDYTANADLAIDFGIGLDKAFKSFNFSPEIRYSIGLLNVNRHPAIEPIYFHKISLVFNFLG